MKKILVIHGPNLNMLGKRNKLHYGKQTLEEINELMKNNHDFQFEFFQSNHEGEIIDAIQKAEIFDALIINPAAYTHTSIAIRDALETLSIVKIEVHLSDIFNREEFRKTNLISDVCDKIFIGEHENSYLNAVNYLKKYFFMV